MPFWVLEHILSSEIGFLQFEYPAANNENLEISEIKCNNYKYPDKISKANL